MTSLHRTQSTSGERYWRKIRQVAIAEFTCPECEAEPGQRCFKLSRIWGRVECDTHGGRDRLAMASIYVEIGR